MLTVKCCAPEGKRKAFRKRVVQNRTQDLKKVHEAFKKIATDEKVRVQELFREHVDFFKEPEEDSASFIVKEVQVD